RGPLPAGGPPLHFRRVRIVLDADRCTGHGRCYSLAPELFDSDDEGHSVVLHEEVPGGQEDAARLAANTCPESAIRLEG
ncbi:MAG: ferredoxin, partial [Acidimicrobiales bacterium]